VTVNEGKRCNRFRYWVDYRFSHKHRDPILVIDRKKQNVHKDSLTHLLYYVRNNTGKPSIDARRLQRVTKPA